MEKLVIHGGARLCGTVTPEGSKNAALPLIFASMLTDGVSVINGVPDITDVRVALSLMRSYGAVGELENGVLRIDTSGLKYKKPDRALTSSIRASSYLLGAALARFGRFDISEIGGCNFCNRPIDMHIAAAEALGAVTDGNMIVAKKLVGADIVFDKVSVGATINALIMAATAEGSTRIYGAAREPHCRQLIEFLISAGARITETEDIITVEGTALHGGEVTVIPDMIEAGTYLIFGAATGGRVTVRGAASLGLDSFLQVLADGGVTVISDGEDITLCGIPYSELRVVTAPYPEYPTDLQPQIAPLMALGAGGTINETVWQRRFSYLDALSLFGLEYELSGSLARVKPSILRAARTYVPDLRGGAAAVACALSAAGDSVIENSEIIARGYARFAERLASLGADIKQIKEN